MTRDVPFTVDFPFLKIVPPLWRPIDSIYSGNKIHILSPFLGLYLHTMVWKKCTKGKNTGGKCDSPSKAQINHEASARQNKMWLYRGTKHASAYRHGGISKIHHQVNK